VDDLGLVLVGANGGFDATKRTLFTAEVQESVLQTR
jgi:hypothetical protein